MDMGDLQTPHQDFCCHAVSPTELHRSLACLVSDLGQQFNEVKRSSVEHAHSTRAISQQFLNMQEQLHDRVTELHISVEQRLAVLEANLEAYQAATNLLVRNLQAQFEAGFDRNHAT